MRDIRCRCTQCGRAFVWTHEERVAALEDFHPIEATDTRRLKKETDRMKRPDRCGGCRRGRP